MTEYFKTQTQAGIDTTPWAEIKQVASKIKNAVIAVMTEDEALSNRQIRWFKGVLLPALAKDTGYTESYWETRLKLSVMPEKFEPVPFDYQGVTYYRIPSITILSTKEMTQLMEGAVHHLREDNLPKKKKQYHGLFDWVVMPDSSLRKE